MNLGITHIAFDAARWSVSDPPWLAEGVRGYAALLRDELWVNMVLSDPPGQGHMGAYLDALVSDVEAVEPLVRLVRIIMAEPNTLMRAMLSRRGFRTDWRELPPEAPFEEVVKVMVYD